MSYESPGLYDSTGKELSVTPGNTIPSGTKGILDIGSDSGIARTKNVDANGRQIIVGAAANGAVIVGNPNLIAGSDGYNVRNIRTDNLGNIQTVEARNNYATYAASNPDGASTGILLGTTTSVIYLFHPSTESKSYQVKRILISATGGTGTATYSIRADFITAQAGTPGGTLVTPQPLNRSDIASNAIVRINANAPTRLGNDPWSICLVPGNNFVFDLASNIYDGKAITLRGGISEGIEVRIVIGGLALLTASRVSAALEWVEV
jgi:hypothetical protein